MTGPEHYRQAEEMLDALRRSRANPTLQINHEKAATLLAEAQVHATLALAASSVFNLIPATDADREGWAGAISTPDRAIDPLDNIT
ncbi:hypothetical protein [Streptomyces sp. NPDC088115]|uniref:hypothetical protein n=1 Tax=Streptomyces sp. NPDC088115 TaxID=3365824 RepID=UPI00381E9CF4